jgi:PII-like signaling protein
MMQTGTAKRMMIFIDETDHFHGANLAASLVDTLCKEGLSGATAMRGMTGFGVHGHVHTTHLVDLSVNLPIVITVVDTIEKIDLVLPIIQEMIAEGLIVVDEVQAIRMNGKKQETH